MTKEKVNFLERLYSKYYQPYDNDLEFFRDEEIKNFITKHNTVGVISKLPEELKEDKEYNLDIILRNHNMFKYIDSSFRNDPAIFDNFFIYLHEKIAEELLNYVDDLELFEKLKLRLSKKGTKSRYLDKFVPYVRGKYKNDPNKLKFIELSVSTLSSSSDSQKARMAAAKYSNFEEDKEFLKYAIKINEKVLPLVRGYKSLRYDYDFMAEMLGVSPHVYNYVPEDLKSDKKFIEKASEYCPEIYFLIDDTLKPVIGDKLMAKKSLSIIFDHYCEGLLGEYYYKKSALKDSFAMQRNVIDLLLKKEGVKETMETNYYNFKGKNMLEIRDLLKKRAVPMAKLELSRDLLLESVKYFGFLFPLASKDFKDDDNFIIQCAKENIFILFYLPKKYFNNMEFMNKLVAEVDQTKFEDLKNNHPYYYEVLMKKYNKNH